MRSFFSKEQARAFREALASWTLGMAFATPTIAIFQGLMMLRSFRNDHADAPHPKMPARGMVMVQHDDAKQQQQQQQQQAYLKPPLRLLIIGDSLAAGVGITKSTTPILPESIARSLSKGLGGRAVSWTCMGTPGNALSQTMSEMSVINENIPAIRLWWEQRKKRLEEFQEKENKRLEQQQQQQQQQQDRKETEDDIIETIKQTIKETTTKATVRIDRMRTGFRRDVQDFNEIVLRRDSTTPSKPSKGIQGEENQNNNKNDVVQTRTTTSWENPGRHVLTEYDVTVVVTGLNDIKSVFLPQELLLSVKVDPMDKDNMEAQHQRQVLGIKRDFLTAVGVWKGQMNNLLPQALKRITDSFHLDDDDNDNDGDGDDNNNDNTNDGNNKATSETPRRYHKLMVFPAFPYLSTRPAPLSLFILPFCYLIDENKRMLAKKYPGRIVFVEMLASEDKADYEAHTGRFRAGTRDESVRFNWKGEDVLEHGRERAEKVLREYYRTWTANVVDRIPDESLYSYDDIMGVNLASAHRIHVFGSRRLVGSSLVNIDKIHLNDDGYELWGRHIAEAILKEWGL